MTAAIKVLILFTLLTGIVYPYFITGVAQIFFNAKANGSLLEREQKVIGSKLIGQHFQRDTYFKSRPSAVNYDPRGSGATNLSVTSKILKKSIQERSLHFKSHDLLTSSSSGLDPHITLEAALEQADSVVLARGLDENYKKKVIDLIRASVEGKTLGFMGNERVNVLMLNSRLDELL